MGGEKVKECHYIAILRHSPLMNGLLPAGARGKVQWQVITDCGGKVSNLRLN